MQFVVIGLDGTDKDAPLRRQAARQSHIEIGDALLKSRNLVVGSSAFRVG